MKRGLYESLVELALNGAVVSIGPFPASILSKAVVVDVEWKDLGIIHSTTFSRQQLVQGELSGWICDIARSRQPRLPLPHES